MVLIKKDSKRKAKIYNSISDNQLELLNFNGILKLIKIIINHLNQPQNLTTIRDIYYQDVEIFNKNQQECKKLLVELFEESFGWSLTDDLNIHPTQKGLFFSNILVNKYEVSLIPINFIEYFKDIKLERNTIKVIILEKDAVFQSFCQYLMNQKHQLNNHQFKYIIITAKGFADNLTIKFLTFLNLEFQPTTIYGFFDSDIYGIMIYSQYKEKCGDNIEFNGIFLMDIAPKNWLNISDRDFGIMSTMSNKDVSTTTHREITRGMYFHKKVEMNVISDKSLTTDTNYNQYIFKKVFQ
ncbi:uncharacterized protein KGF55_001361 [Candida pseudojiufengensis]|uniref:uncharacterized protein n=1 Tax=Candida pseudojiufengensis TaxID=497109 RepID=UPI0022243E46|nr:uncharacterized protein KGF55_001361 [Candida pseudojiufengensis]KAI5965141.1 hypothetical protein KGF55_001361 [Candida pseudojiufengensis]